MVTLGNRPRAFGSSASVKDGAAVSLARPMASRRNRVWSSHCFRGRSVTTPVAVTPGRNNFV